MAVTELSTADVLRHRVAAQQLMRPPDPARALTDAAVLDLGVQDTGADGAAWALACRGVPTSPAAALRPDGERSAEFAAELALAWTIRGAPHLYRRRELPDVLRATSPFSEADAAKRVFDAVRPLRRAGLSAQEGLTEVATAMRAIVTATRDKAMAKGELSGRLRAALPEPYLRSCVPCGAVHPYEMTFRLAALRAGLELDPGSSPPVLRRVPRWPVRSLAAPDPDAAPEHLDVVRAALHLLGPATPAEVAGYLDAPKADVVRRWPTDAVPVRVDGVDGSALLEPDLPRPDADDPDGPDERRVVLLAGFDLFLQSRDRARLVPAADRRRVLWPSIGRPGAVLALGAGPPELTGCWRPASKGGRLGVRVQSWLSDRADRRLAPALDAAGEQLARHRGQSFAGITAG